MENKPLVIGITGVFGSGKSTAADFLKDLGFVKISLVQFLEEELIKQGEKKITRKLLQDLGNEWREKYGAEILAQKALELVQKVKAQKAVIEGFRNVSEIEFLKQNSRFILIGIVVNRDIRLERLKKTKRREELTPELFEELDDRDLGLGEQRSGLQVAFCIARSEVFIENNGDLTDLKKRIQGIIKENMNE